MASLGLPHWLIIAGSLLAVAGIIGILVSRKAEEIEPPSDEPSDAPRQQMPPFAKPSRLQARNSVQ